VILAVDLGVGAWMNPPRTVTQLVTSAELAAALAVGYRLAAEVVRRCRLNYSFRRLRDAVIFSVVGLAGGRCIGAGVDAGLEQPGAPDRPAILAVHRVLRRRGAAGIFAVAPLILLTDSWLATRRPRDRRAPVEAMLRKPLDVRSWATVAELLAQAAAFGLNFAFALRHGPQGPVFYPLLVPLFWIAVRRGTNWAIVGITVGGCVLTALAHTIGVGVDDVNPLETFLPSFRWRGCASAPRRSNASTPCGPSMRARRASRGGLRLTA
jgi:hypothetical protein